MAQLIESEFFFGIHLTKEESAILDQTSHSQLLDEAWAGLTNSLDASGNSERFFELHDQHSRQLLAYWKVKTEIYRGAKNVSQTGSVSEDYPFVRGSERLWGREEIYRGPDDTQVLTLTRSTGWARDEAILKKSLRWGYQNPIYDEQYPPIIKSVQYLNLADVSYRVTFSRNRYRTDAPFKISRLERQIYHQDPKDGRRSIKDERVINVPLDSPLTSS